MQYYAFLQKISIIDNIRSNFKELFKGFSMFDIFKNRVGPFKTNWSNSDPHRFIYYRLIWHVHQKYDKQILNTEIFVVTVESCNVQILINQISNLLLCHFAAIIMRVLKYAAFGIDI